MKSRQIKIDEDVHADLVHEAQIRKMNMGSIVGYLWDIHKKYDLLDPDWLGRVTEERITDYLSKHDTDLSKRLEIEKARTINKAKYFAFTEYIKLLEPDAKKELLQNILGNMQDDQFIDNLSSYQMFNVDGTNRFYPVLDGKPIIAGTDPRKIVACEMGYHISGSFCKCNLWRKCPLRQNEYGKYLMETDPNMLKEKTRRFQLSYRDNNR